MHAVRIRTRAVHAEPVERLQCSVADQNCRAVFLLQMKKMRTDFLPLLPDPAARPVRVILLEILRQNTLPVGFDRIVQRVPVPVLDHVGAARQMRVSLQPQLPVEGQPVREALAFRLENQIIVLLHRARKISAERNLHAGQLILRRMIDVRSHNGHRLRVLEDIDLAVQSVGVSLPGKIRVVSDELVLTEIRLHDLTLPHQEIRRQLPLEFCELRAKAGVDRPSDIRKIFPRVDPIAPVIKSEFRIELIQISVELLLQILHKGLLDIPSAGIVGLRLIIELHANHAGKTCALPHHLPDHPLRIKPVNRACDVHILAPPVPFRSLVRDREHIRIFPDQPCRHRIGGRPENDGNARPIHRFDHPRHMMKVKDAILRLAGAPGALPDPHHIHTGLFHQPDVLLQPLARHILVVIGCAIQ